MEYLMVRAAECGKSTFEIPYDRQELADYLEVDRSGLSAEIGKLKREGIIDNHKSSFTIL
jgi:CRP-like cAMP-binding protein